MRANAGLHEGDNFAFEPGEVGVHREDDEEEQADLNSGEDPEAAGLRQK
jgi:hypothetical protein